MSNNPRDWWWSEDFDCWISRDSNFAFPKAFCRGDRFVYGQGGRDTPYSHFRGSTPENWGGYSWGQDLAAALKWLSEAKGVDNYSWTSAGGNNNPQLDLFKEYER